MWVSTRISEYGTGFIVSALSEFHLAKTLRKRKQLLHADAKQDRPILQGLKREAGQNQANAKDAHAFFGHMIGHPLDEGRAGTGDSRDHADSNSHSEADRDPMLPMRGQAADETGNRIAHGAIGSRQ